MRQFKQMFLAQLKMTLREKQAWFWGIFFPVILMVIFMLIFGGSSDDDFEAKVAIVNKSKKEANNELISHLKNIPMLNIVSEKSTEKEAADLVKERKIDAAIILPASETDTSFELLINKENENDISTQIISGAMGHFVQQANLAAADAAPIYDMKFKTVSSSANKLDYSDFILTGIIALSIAQGGLFGMVDLVEYRRKGMIKRLRMTPANIGLFGLSDMVMRLLFNIVQILLLSFIGVFAFGANLYINFASLLFIFLIGALTFNALGYFISSFSNTTEAYMGIANIFSFIMMFLSGIFFPIEMMPEWIRPISNLLPLTYFADGLRDSMIYEISIFSTKVWAGIGVMTLWGGIAFLLGSILYRRKSIVSTR